MLHLHKTPVWMLVLTWVLAELQSQVYFFVQLDSSHVGHDVQELSDQPDVLQKVQYPVDEVDQN